MTRASALAILVFGCGATGVGAPAGGSYPAPGAPSAPHAEAGPPDKAGEGGAEVPGADRVDEGVLAAVAGARGLPARHPVRSERATRERAIARIVEKTRREVPAPVLRAQGELFAALGLSPPDYPFVEGMFRLLEDNVAGFYDPDADTMVLLEDLSASDRDQTLTHELVHALQDQHFDLGGRLDYERGKADEHAALACLAEGDATSAMFPRRGDAAPISPEALRIAMAASVALSSAGASAPHALQKALIAPYVDGFRFIEALRERGGWDEVNRAWRSPPISTEQILHVEKYDRREPPLEVPEPSPGPLGVGWRTLDADVGGEQALRLVLEQWLSPPEAARAAAGWGGDRFAIFVRDDAEGASIALEWRVRFDDGREAEEAARLLARGLPACLARSTLGPLAWRRNGRDIVVAAGPYRRTAAGSVEALPGAGCSSALRRVADRLR